MSLTVKTEKEVLKVYDTWLHSYLNGDVPTYNSFLDDAFHFIGSTSSEEFLNRKDTTNFFDATAEQLSGKTDLRNETKIVEQFGEVVFITHLFDAWFLAGADWSFYGRFRCTNALQKNQDGWRFIYQHYSTPDSKAQEGQTIGFDQVTAENLQLREAIQRRTKELEEKNRELEIEGALERIRAKAVAMKDSSDLLDIVVSMRAEFIKLGHEAHYFWHMMWLPETYEKAMTSGDGTKIGFVMKLPRHIHGDIPLLAKWEKSNTPIVVYAMDTEAAIDYVDKMVSLGDFQNIDPQAPSEDDIRHIGGLTFIMARTTHGEIGYSLPGVVENPPKEDLAILEKFAGAFDLAHRRFLDLQKAEKQAREVQIELALEKVRSRTMAMQKSEELKEVIQVVYDQFVQLNINIEHTGFILDYQENEDMHIWLADQNAVFPQIVLPYFDCAHWNSFKEAKKKGTHFFTNQLDFEEKNKFYKDLFQFIPELPEEVKEHYFTCPALAISTVLLDNVGLYIENYTGTPFSEEENKILMRFGKVFQQTYTRFLDLQRAEAQAREARIEAALERIRSQSMGMQTTDDLSKVTTEMFNQLRQFGGELFATGIVFCEKHKDHVEQWHSIPNAGMMSPFIVPIDLDYIHQYRYDQWKKGAELFSVEIPSDFIEQHFNDIFQLPSAQKVLKDLKDKNTPMPKAPPWEIDYGASFKYGYLLVSSLEHFEEAEILPRFANVFEQTYTRFLDLQKAEAQAQEAKIEASLEKVRSVALTLKKSDDMLEIAKVLYEQLLELGFTDIRNAIIDIHNDENETFLDYDYSHDMSSAVTEFSYYGDPVIEQQIKKTQSGNDAFFEIELKGEQLKELIETRLKNGEKDDPRLHETDHLTYNLYSFGNGAIGISNFGILSDAQKKVLKRFRNVFTFAYKRYTDLANAEAQAMEAKIEASLEKVRSVALGLNKSDDMLEVAQALYEQLLALGFTNIRNSIIDIDNGDGLTFSDYDYSRQMGGTVTQMSYKDDPTLKEQLEDIIATTDGFSEMVLEGQQLQDLIDMRRNNGEADDPRLLNTDSLSYILYAFGKGAIGISNFGVLPEHQKSILNRFRNVFTFAYQRYTDLAQSEAQAEALLAEKQQLEKTLKDLQATQKQLIQSEKMASLGELTAGIAHEIQNPLNFVNNFSEVSNELIEEIDEELAKGDMEEVKLLLNDIKQNLVKINHHGKRADAIVKGMLQHSRKSTADKVPTDINKLADEYLRLAYHGLRAKDKSFNATLETDFDETIGLVNVIPQDMGRVILNLITNAFYAAHERKKASKDSDFKPTVSITTRKLKNKVTISVDDNGDGIPNHVVDKIFQPFFTTKPTGEGTGLGLSMSYDIVRAHGGELHVNTTEREGTQFMIHIPEKTTSDEKS
jgi:signal transduction histidine kinase/ketosteroid isomerase-like protein